MIAVQEFVERLRRDFDTAVRDVAEPLISGRSEDFASYCRASGEIEGLRKARELLDNVVKMANEGR